MKNTFKNKIWPVLAGLLSAFVIMIIFEFVNSLFYSLPEGLDIYNYQAVKSFTLSLPFTAFILVFLGFILGAFKAGCVTTYLSKLNKKESFKLSMITGGILTIFAVMNNMMIGQPSWFMVISTPMFLIFVYLGHKFMSKKLK